MKKPTPEQKSDARKAAAILEGKFTVGDEFESKRWELRMRVIKAGPKWVTVETFDLSGKPVRFHRGLWPLIEPGIPGPKLHYTHEQFRATLASWGMVK